MKKTISFLLFMLFLQCIRPVFSQVTGKITYSDTFVQGVTYCPSSSQYSNWGSFRSKLDTANYKIMSITIKGTYDKSGRTCSDSFIARKLVQRLKYPTAGTDLTLNCGTFKWVVSGTGTCYSAGSCSNSTDNVGLGADGQVNACNCISNSYQIRPIIGNSNWGGVNSASCPGPSQRMTVEVNYRLYPLDAGITRMETPGICSNPNKIVAVVVNSGSKNLDSLKVSWSLNGVFQSQVSLLKTLNSFRDTSIVVATGVNFNPYTHYVIKVWTSAPNGQKDNYLSNDTFTNNFFYTGTPSAPHAKDTGVCGTGSVVLKASAKQSGDSVVWYASKTGFSPLGIGRYYKTTPLSPGLYKFYIGASGQVSGAYLQTSFGGGNQQAGFMLDLKSLKNNRLDSLAVNLGAAAGTNADIEVYYREGGYQGYESMASAWSKLGTYKVVSKGAGNPTLVPAKLNLPEGKLYGIYIQTTNAPSFFLQYGNLASSVTSDEALQITTGVGVGLNFGNLFTGRNGNVRFYYKTLNCLSLRDSLWLKVEKKPYGSLLKKGLPFQSPDISTLGTLASPDLVAIGHEINYEILPPTGLSNQDYGTKWKITKIDMFSGKGTAFPSEDSSIYWPGGTSNGKIKIKPGAEIEDSVVTINVTLKDLTNNLCDSTIQRVFLVLPIPYTNFTSRHICFGTSSEFKNLSRINSGSVSFKWHFGNGDSSEVVSPNYKYPAFGMYTVRLIATSNYGIKKDTSMQLQIFEVPDIKYSVVNACDGDSLKFTNLTTMKNGTPFFTWDFGDGNYSSKSTKSHLYYLPGTYIVTLNASSNGCNASLSKKANQFNRPKAHFEISGDCNYSPVQFINKSTIALGENFGSTWKFGDGSFSNFHNPSHEYEGKDTVTVKYIATSQFGCRDSMSKTLSLKPNPVASFIHNPTCENKPVYFTNTTTELAGLNTEYSWDFGDGMVSNDKSPTHTYKLLGLGTIILKAASANGCSTQYKKEITIFPQPETNFQVKDECAGEPVKFNNTSTGSGLTQFTWHFGDGDSSQASSPVKKYKTVLSSTYNVTLMGRNLGGCADTITKPVNILEVPLCQYTYKSAQTGGYEYIFSPQFLNYSVYQWFFDGGANYNVKEPKHTFAKDGKYRITVFMKNSEGCNCVDSSGFITINHLNVKAITQDQVLLTSPNPSSGSFQISLTNQEAGIKLISIVDARGIPVADFNGLYSKTQFVNLGHPATGVYILKVQTMDGYWYFKPLIIQN